MRKKTILVVVAHADDMEFMAAGMLARLIIEKHYDVYQYILTDNGRGSFRLPEKELVEISAREAVEAGKVLGLKEVRLEGYSDGYLNEVPANVLRGKIMAFIREVRADIVMSWDPFAPYEEHPDHRAVSMATLEAAGFSGNPMFYPEHKHPAYPCTESYWFAKSPWNADCYVDISTTIDLKIEALLKHDCQMLLTLDSLTAEAKAIGADVAILQDVTPDSHRQLIDVGIRRWCAETGSAKGMEYAERFRYQKLAGLDLMLGGNFIVPDY